MKKLILNNFKKLMSIMLTALLFLQAISFEVFAEDPKVSIIIPVYNTPENLLRNCLESAKNQTLNDIEIICVDDESTNGSGKILDEYAKADPRFKVVHQKNGGVSVARNNGMNIAKGEYIKFLDSDDLIDDITAEKSYYAAKKYDADIVKYSVKDVEMGYRVRKFDGCIDRPTVINAPIFRGDLLFNVVWAALYRNKFIKDNNLKFFENVHYSEDVYFSAICVPKANKVVLLPDKLYTYKMNPTSAVNNAAKKAKRQQSSLFLGIKLLYNNWKRCGHFNHDSAKLEFLRWLLYTDDFKLLHVFKGKSAQFDKICRKIMDPHIFQDNSIKNQLPVNKIIQIKKMMFRANPKVNPQKTVDDGIYTISSKLDPNYCLSIKGGSKNDGANLELSSQNETDAQKFKIQYNSDGYYTIKAMCSGRVLDVPSGSRNILQCTKNKRNSQKWFIFPDGEGYYYLASKCDNLCMDVEGAEAKNGANIHCYSVHGGDSQKFKLEECEDKPSSSRPNRARKLAAKPRPNKPVEIKKNAGKPGDSEKST